MSAGLGRSLGLDVTSFTLGDRAFRIRELTLEQMHRLATELERRAYLGIERQTYLPDAVRREMRLDLVAAVAAGEYEPGGTAYARAMFTVPGLAYTLFLSAQGEDDRVTLEDCEAMVRAKFEEVAAAISEANPVDPKASSADPEGSPPGAT